MDKDNDLRRRDLSPPGDTISRFESTSLSQRSPKKTLSKSKSVTQLEVAVSPERRPQPVQESRSPGRIILGIDKGLTGKNISLRKAPRAPTQTPLQLMQAKYPQTTRPKTFNEKMAESREEDKENGARKERIERLRQQRSAGFDIQREELDKLKKDFANDQTPHLATQSSSLQSQNVFSREEVLKAASQAPDGLIYRKDTVSGVHHSSQYSSSENTTKAASRLSSSRSKSLFSSWTPNAHALRSPPPISSPDPFLDLAKEPPTNSLFDPISSTHLSRRMLPEVYISRLLKSKTPQLMPGLLRTIKSPKCNIPPSLIESDFVVFGIIASK